jgi:hypothetical protein
VYPKPLVCFLGGCDFPDARANIQLKQNMDSFKGHASEYSINKLAEFNGRARTIASEVQAKIRNVDNKHRVRAVVAKPA